MSSQLSITDEFVLSGRARLVRVRPFLVHTAVAGLLVMSLAHAVTSYRLQMQPANASPHSVLSTVTSSRTAAPRVAPSPSGGAATPAGGTPTPKVVRTIPALSSCTPDLYAGPAALDLSTAQPGLSQLVDATHYYQIYGYNATQARQQINQCAPRLSSNGDDYTGYTAYRLSWLYNYGSNGNGQCTLSNVKVGIRIGEVLPLWQLSQYADSTFATAWQSFVPALDMHERGHIALNEQYAAKLTSDLQSFAATDCSTISQAANDLINSEVAALNQANVNYDAQTNHGATQGAMLP